MSFSMRFLCFLIVATVFGAPPTRRPRPSIDEIANRLRGEAAVSSSKQQALTEDDNVRGHSRVDLRRCSEEPRLPETGRDSRRSMSVDRPRDITGIVPGTSDESFGRVSDAIRYLFSIDAASVNLANRELIPMIRALLTRESSATNAYIGVRLVELKREYPSQISAGNCRNVKSAIRRLFDEEPSCIFSKNKDLFAQVRAMVPHCRVSDGSLNSKISRVRTERKGPIADRSATGIANRLVLEDPTRASADIDREVRSVMKSRSLKQPSDKTDVLSNARAKLRKQEEFQDM